MSSKTTPKKSTPNKNAKAPSASSNTAAGEYLLERLRILLHRLQATTELLQNWPETQGDYSAKIHADSATELIASMRKIVLGIRSVERHVNGTGPAVAQGSSSGSGEQGSTGSSSGSSAISKEALEAFRVSLEEKCPIPLDLLDLLNVGGQPFGLNPQCYARGLMKESMRQLAGLERRKRALDMLAGAIEVGITEGGRVEDDHINHTSNNDNGSKVKMEEEKEESKKVISAKEGNDDAPDGNQASTKRKRDEEDEAESAKKIARTD